MTNSPAGRARCDVTVLTGSRLDKAVALAEGLEPYRGNTWVDSTDPNIHINIENYMPSRKWEDGGRIVERERIAVVSQESDKWPWLASVRNPPVPLKDLQQGHWWGGDTALVAAMRAYVIDRIGRYIDLPDEPLSTPAG